MLDTWIHVHWKQSHIFRNTELDKLHVSVMVMVMNMLILI